MRPFIYAANWKLNKSPKETKAFFRDFMAAAGESNAKKNIVFFVPALSFQAACDATEAATTALGMSASMSAGMSAGMLGANQVATRTALGIQNAYFETSGAFTGENSISVAKEMGATWVLVGHSERRTIFGETDGVVSKKVEAGLAQGLKVMLCVGETLAEREAGQTMKVVERQTLAGLTSAVRSKLSQAPHEFALAYEPVWAIGTGKVASPEQASEVHQFLRGLLTQELGANVAEEISILYGGSVKAENAKSLGQMPGIDGFLVGGASLDPRAFQAIISA